MAKLKSRLIEIALIVGFITFAFSNSLQGITIPNMEIIMLMITTIVGVSAWFYYIYEFKVKKTQHTSRPIETKNHREDARYINDRMRRISARYMALEEIKSMDPYKFEAYVASIYRELGYSVRQTKRSGDGGKDLIMHKDNETYFVECKRYKSNIGSSKMRDFIGACDLAGTGVKGIYVTTSNFTNEAQKAARMRGIELVNGDRLMYLLEQIENK